MSHIKEAESFIDVLIATKERPTPDRDSPAWGTYCGRMLLAAVHGQVLVYAELLRRRRIVIVVDDDPEAVWIKRGDVRVWFKRVGAIVSLSGKGDQIEVTAPVDLHEVASEATRLVQAAITRIL